jgi:hypothetical protein
MTLTDKRGKVFHEGCEVVRAVAEGSLEISTVTKIEDNKLYLNNRKVPIKYPRRLLIIKQDPLYQMVKTYDESKK